MLYIAKVYLKRQLLGVKLYEKYEHFVSDLADEKSALYENVPEGTKFDARRPFIVTSCYDILEYSTVFEYRYENDLVVYCGQAMTEENVRRSRDD